MSKLRNRMWRSVAASLLGLGIATSVFAQASPPGGATTPVPQTAPSPTSTDPTGIPKPMQYSPGPPSGANELPPTGLGAGAPYGAPMSPVQTYPILMQSAPSQDTGMSSKPAPFQVAPGTAPAAPGDTAAGDRPAASNDQNFYAGNPPVQDLSSLLAGNFKDTKYKWYGFVRLDGIFDFNPIRSTDDFVTSSIPVPQGRGQNAVLTPRYTRIGFDTETPWKDMDWTIKTRIEMDFFNGNTSGAFGSFPLRLRFAWVDFGPFLIGQAASLFMDYDLFPNVLDYEGPPGFVLMRQPIAAVRCPIGDHLKVSFGIEQPYSDIQWFEDGVWNVNPGTGIIATPGIGRNVQDMPDFTGNVRFTADHGHVQVAGIVRKLTFQPAVGPDDNVYGYGVNLTGDWHPWSHLHGCGACEEKSPLDKSRFMAQFATGKGINRYIQDINGLGLDATFDPINGFQALESTGWYVGYEHWWTQKWISVITYGETNCNLTNTLPDNTYDSATYASANLIWLPVERMGVGLEYLYGTRTNKDGQSGTAHRIQMGFQYKF